MGAGTYTGIEAVSNSVQTLREPRIDTAKKVMLYMAFSLSFIAGGLTLGYLLNGISPVTGKTLNAVLFDRLLTELWPGQVASVTLVVVLLSEATLLFVAAQTGFIVATQVLSNMSIDSYIPRRYS